MPCELCTASHVVYSDCPIAYMCTTSQCYCTGNPEPEEMHMDAMQERFNALVKRNIAVTAYVHIDAAFRADKFNDRWRQRLFSMITFMCSCAELVFENQTHAETTTDSIVHVSRFFVRDPLAFHYKATDMVQNDCTGFWKHDFPLFSARRSSTFVLYCVLRKMGFHPRTRGPPENDPGPQDMLYYCVWEFVDNDAYRKGLGQLRLHGEQHQNRSWASFFWSSKQVLALWPKRGNSWGKTTVANTTKGIKPCGSRCKFCA